MMCSVSSAQWLCVWIHVNVWWQKPGRAGAAREILLDLFLDARPMQVWHPGRLMEEQAP